MVSFGELLVGELTFVLVIKTRVDFVSFFSDVFHVYKNGIALILNTFNIIKISRRVVAKFKKSRVVSEM